jgi:hypothetical protein
VEEEEQHGRAIPSCSLPKRGHFVSSARVACSISGRPTHRSSAAAGAEGSPTSRRWTCCGIRGATGSGEYQRPRGVALRGRGVDRASGGQTAVDPVQAAEKRLQLDRTKESLRTGR